MLADSDGALGFGINPATGSRTIDGRHPRTCRYAPVRPLNIHDRFAPALQFGPARGPVSASPEVVLFVGTVVPSVPECLAAEELFTAGAALDDGVNTRAEVAGSFSLLRMMTACGKIWEELGTEVLAARFGFSTGGLPIPSPAWT